MAEIINLDDYRSSRIDESRRRSSFSQPLGRYKNIPVEIMELLNKLIDGDYCIDSTLLGYRSQTIERLMNELSSMPTEGIDDQNVLISIRQYISTYVYNPLVDSLSGSVVSFEQINIKKQLSDLIDYLDSRVTQKVYFPDSPPVELTINEPPYFELLRKRYEYIESRIDMYKKLRGTLNSDRILRRYEACLNKYSQILNFGDAYVSDETEILDDVEFESIEQYVHESEFANELIELLFTIKIELSKYIIRQFFSSLGLTIYEKYEFQHLEWSNRITDLFQKNGLSIESKLCGEMDFRGWMEAVFVNFSYDSFYEVLNNIMSLTEHDTEGFIKNYFGESLSDKFISEISNYYINCRRLYKRQQQSVVMQLAAAEIKSLNADISRILAA